MDYNRVSSSQMMAASSKYQNLTVCCKNITGDLDLCPLTFDPDHDPGQGWINAGHVQEGNTWIHSPDSDKCKQPNGGDIVHEGSMWLHFPDGDWCKQQNGGDIVHEGNTDIASLT